jgi:hypothetical protein
MLGGPEVIYRCPEVPRRLVFRTEDAGLFLRSPQVRRWAVGVLGIWRGEGLGKGWNKGGQFTSNLRLRWTDPVTARRVPSK